MESMTHAMSEAAAQVVTSLCEAVQYPCSSEHDLEGAPAPFIPEHFIPQQKNTARRSSMFELYSPPKAAVHVDGSRRSSVPAIKIPEKAELKRRSSVGSLTPDEVKAKFQEQAAVNRLITAQEIGNGKEQEDGYYHHDEGYSWTKNAKQLQEMRKKIHHELTPDQKWFQWRKYQHQRAGRPPSHEQEVVWSAEHPIENFSHLKHEICSHQTRAARRQREHDALERARVATELRNFELTSSTDPTIIIVKGHEHLDGARPFRYYHTGAHPVELQNHVA